MSNVTELIENILRRDDPYEPYLHRNLFEAGRLLAVHPSVDPQVGERVLGRLFSLVLNTRINALRNDAALVLAGLLETSWQALVLRGLDAVIEQPGGAWRLAIAAADPAGRGIAARLLSDSDWKVRRQGVNRLTVSDAETRAALLADPHWWVRLAALHALPDDSELRPALFSLLADPAPSIRAAAAQALAAAGGPACGQALLPLLGDPVGRVQEAAATALAPRVVHEPAICAALLPLLSDRDARVRASAVRALASAGTNPAVCAAALPLQHDPDCRVRAASAPLFGAAGDNPDAAAALVALTTDTESEVSRDACTALAAASGKAAVRAKLLSQLASPKIEISYRSAEAVAASISDPAVQSALSALLSNPNWYVRYQAARILASCASRLEDVLPLLTSRNPSVQWGAIQGLEYAAGEPPVRDILLSLLADPDCENRDTVAAKLAATGDASLLPALLPILLPPLTDPDRYVRDAAVRRLGRFASDPGVRAAMLPLLHDSHNQVRRAVVEKLVPFIGEPAVYEALVALIADEDSFVSVPIIEALGPAAATNSALSALLKSLIMSGDSMYLSAVVSALVYVPPDHSLIERLGEMFDYRYFGRDDNVPFRVLTRWAEASAGTRDDEGAD